MSTTLELRSSTTMRHRSTARRKITDLVVKGLAWIGALIGLGVMTFVVWEVIVNGAQVWSVAFFTQSTPQDPMSETGGFANAIFGTLVITGVAALLAIPTGFLGGIYLAEFGRSGRLATAIRMIANVVMGVPSIIVGVFIYAILVYPLLRRGIL